MQKSFSIFICFLFLIACNNSTPTIHEEAEGNTVSLETQEASEETISSDADPLDLSKLILIHI